jgi:hypothetical protein
MFKANKEILAQSAIALVFLLMFYCLFFLLQQDIVYRHSLGKITTTYQRLEGHWNIANVHMPYKKITDQNLVNWDAVGYYYQKNHNPGPEDVRSSYGFFPMFPWIWKITHIPLKLIGVFNFLLYAISLMVLMKLFLSAEKYGFYDRLIIFTLGLCVPSVIIYLIPYSEAVFTVTFALAIWGLSRRSYWIYFLFMTAFAMTRASVIIVIFAFVVTDFIYLLRYRNFSASLREFVLKITPVIVGMFLVFTWDYYWSGNFFKYYEVQSTYWTNNLQWPRKLEDWSVEGFGMNIAAIFLLAIPAVIFFFSRYSLRPEKGEKKDFPSLFTGDIQQIREYFIINSIVYFAGFCLYVLMFRGGGIYCLHRFIISSPYFLIFLLGIAEWSKERKNNYYLLIWVPLFIIGFLFVRNNMIDPVISFKDSGFFLFALVSLFLFALPKLKGILKYGLILLIAGYAILWFTFLYNSYISCAWIFA